MNTSIKALTYEDAWNIQLTFPNLPHGWIQWKGTDVCMDIHCECGELTHYDGSHMYIIICPYCARAYFVNGHVQLIEIEEVDRPARTASP